MECDLERLEQHVEVARMKVEAEYDALEAERECERAKKLEQQQCVIADCKQQYMDKICCLLGLIKPKVLEKKACLLKFFECTDRLGYSHIMISDMLKCMDQLNLPLSECEKLMLCRHFDVCCNGRFNYLKFMDAFGAVPDSCPSPANPPSIATNPRVYDYQRTVDQALETMRDKLLCELQNLWRAFKRFDTDKDGVLNVDEFKRVLMCSGIYFDKEDLYHIISEFDTNLNGVVSYEEFIQAILKMKPRVDPCIDRSKPKPPC